MKMIFIDCCSLLWVWLLSVMTVFFTFILSLTSLLVLLSNAQRIHWLSPRYGSIAGGTTVSVYGSGFTTDAYTHANLVFLGSIPCDVIWYTASSTKLECITRPFPGAYQGFISPPLQASLITNGVFYKSTNWQSRFRYHWSYTPQIRQVNPPAAPINTLITIGGYRFYSNLYTYYQRLYTGEHICDPWNYDNNAFYHSYWYSSLYRVQCRVTEQSPGAWNASTVLGHYRGATWNHSQAMMLGFDGKLSMYEIYPDIHEVFPHAGSINGGTLLTVNGNGFGNYSTNVSIEINGRKCDIIYHSPNQIQCWITTSNNNSDELLDTVQDGYRFKGSRGATYHYFSGSQQLNFNRLYGEIEKFPDWPDKVGVVPSFSSEDTHNGYYYTGRYMAFFTPVQNGTHTFFMTVDDVGRLYISDNQNISELQLIASRSHHTAWDVQPYQYNDLRSSPLKLIAGHQYLLVGDMMEGDGHDFFRVGVLLHETSFYNNETAQSINERQQLRITSDGLYEIQSITGSVNVFDYDEPIVFVLEWGNRSTNITLLELQSNIDILPSSIISLFKGVCHFQSSFGVMEFAVYDFEEDESVWSSWEGSEAPVTTKEEAFCGYQSLYLPNGKALGFSSSSNVFSITDYPYLCMGYKIPTGVPFGIAIDINGLGWVTITSDQVDNNVDSDTIKKDDLWHFGCINLQTILSSLYLDQSTFTVRGLGFNSPQSDDMQGFYIDHVSFASEKLHLNEENYYAPARPNGLALHQLINTTIIYDNTNDTFNVTVEIIPTGCQYDIPLIHFYPINSTDAVSCTVERLQKASTPVGGTFVIGFKGSSSISIPVDGEPNDIELGIESIEGVNDVRVWRHALAHDKLLQYCPGSLWVIEFTRNPGDLPLLTLDDTTNATGDGLTITVIEDRTGGLFLFPIPGHMLQTVEKTPQVTLKVNNQRGACSGGLGLYQLNQTYSDPCSFTQNNTVTPTVTSISPNTGNPGDSITIHGSGFSTEPLQNYVMFGDVRCNVTMCDSTFIQCTLGHGLGATNKPLWLHVLPIGLANTNGLTLSYPITINSVTPNIAGLGGGIQAIIEGNGFATVTNEESHIGYNYYIKTQSSSDDCTSWETHVYFESTQATVLTVNTTSIKFIIPPSDISDSPNISVVLYCNDKDYTTYQESTENLFTYDDDLTVSVTDIDPLMGSGGGGTTVTINGSGFTSDALVQIGNSWCTVKTVSATSITCVTSPGQHGNSSVRVLVPSTGYSIDEIFYTYQLLVTDVSSCKGSIFGGHTLSISGTGFGGSDQVSVMMGTSPCTVLSTTDTKLVCTTDTSATTHYITNNETNPEYGLGYMWTPSYLTVTAGDTVQWSWTGSPFTPSKRIVQVSSTESNVYNGDGFVSESRVTGNFKHTFTQPGVYYYIMEDYGHIGFRGSIVVNPIKAKTVPLTITVNHIPVSFSPNICGDQEPLYTYSIEATPQILSVSPQELVHQGDIITITVTGIAAENNEYNVLTIGDQPCFISDNSSTLRTKPSTVVISDDVLSYSDGSFECTLPDIKPGSYRVILHTAGRGWAYSSLDNSVINIHHAIVSISSVSGSIHGGQLLSISVLGLYPNMIGHTTVTIGNTPCTVQGMTLTNTNPQITELTCVTRPIINNGYSSLLSADNALVYWSFQYDMYETDGKYVRSEPIGTFSSSLHNNISAIASGNVTVREPGVSGNTITDQAITLNSSSVRISNFSQYANATSFMFEAWFKLSQISDGYTVLASSYNLIDSNIAQGFIITINPCSQVELWLATGHSLSSPPPTDCSSINECSSNCYGTLVYTGNNSLWQYDLPKGVWNKLVSQSSSTLTSNWFHIVFGFQTNNCSDITSPCIGEHLLYVNGKKYSNTSPYYHSRSTDITFGSTEFIPSGTNPLNSLLYPYFGSIDEISFYRSIGESAIKNHYYYGSTGEQPVWVATEFNNEIGNGMIPHLDISPLTPVYLAIGLYINWNLDDHDDYHIPEDSGVLFEWSGIHGLWQVTEDAFVSCIVNSSDSELIKEWSPAYSNGSIHVWLDPGSVYYFIDPVGNNCLEGIKAKVRIGNFTVINWQLGAHTDIILPYGNGLLFQWSGAIPHNVIEMTSNESVSDECLYVGDTSSQLGKIAKEWFSIPSPTGRVAVTGLTIGQHYFVCSVGTHCQNGMRFTVTVLPPNNTPNNPLLNKVSTVYTIPWSIQTYEPLTILDTDRLEFTWKAFHSLHQVTEAVYNACDVSGEPLYIWGEPSVDNSVIMRDLVPGDYYFICSISGHCDSGMKVKVTVLPNNNTPILKRPLLSECMSGLGHCSYSYSKENTPELLYSEPLQSNANGQLTIQVTNYDGDIDDTLNDVLVWIGHSPCTDVTLTNFSINSTDDYYELTCTIPDGQSGLYPIDVQVVSLGYASVVPNSVIGPVRNSSLSLSNYPTLVILPKVTSLSPSTGSTAGGTLLTINGWGFTNIISQVQVYLGTFPCEVRTATRNEITCISTSTNTYNNNNINLSVRINGEEATGTYSYSYASSITPRVASVADGDGLRANSIITINGNGFIPGSTTVQILSDSETFQYDHNSINDCQVEEINSNTITCIVPERIAGSYYVSVLVSNKGLSWTTVSSSVNYILEITDFSPIGSGFGGGVTLEINGTGFTNNGLTVMICETNCAIKDVSINQMSCVLESLTTSNDRDCPVVVSYNSLSSHSDTNFTFQSSLTPTINSFTPSIGGTAGGTLLNIYGNGFLPKKVTDPLHLLPDDIIVTIDSVHCQIISANDTVITCKTGQHKTTISATVNVFIAEKGNALSISDLQYQYIDLWSSSFTWGGSDPPGDGDSVYIKQGQIVFLDIDTAILNLILIEGSLIFQDKRNLHLQAKYIFVNHGKLQIGTEKTPFTHKAIITLHGNVRDPEIPIYGAKVLGVRQGELDLHGIPRNITWTRLAYTALTNSTIITLQDPVDWVAGDNIVIATTSKEGNETETNTIESVSDDGYDITLATPLVYDHYGITDTFEDGHSIELRAEVGLLSHNVIIQGSLSESNPFEGLGADQYGVQIFIHRAGPHPTPIRIEHTEVRFAGQAFRLGRYAIHFHLSGSMNGSYIRHNSIHHSNNRALTAHGVHDLLIEGNVAYDIKGHAFFVEDGVETNNKYLNNLGIFVRGSSSLLNTDQIPAVFWITNPNNIFIGNAAVASRAYGFWYDLDDHPSGPSRTTSVCPNKTPFGTFINNVAHSCNEFGLRIWESYTPFVNGCDRGARVVATLSDFTSYANGIHGVELSIVGHVRLVRFKVADNRDNGIEIQETLGEWGGPMIQDSLIISHSSINTDPPSTGGIKTPNTPHLTISNITFVNFDSPSTSCLKACSHCKPRQGGFQVWFEGLKFQGNSSQHKASFKWEHEVLFRDIDGSLSGHVNAWVVPNSDLYPDQYCNKSISSFSLGSVPGTVCTDDVYLLRLAWNNALPLATLEDVEVNVTNTFGTSIIPWRHYRLTHMDGYMCTLPSKYQHWLTWLLSNDALIDTSFYKAGLYSMRPEDYVILSHEFIQTPDHVNLNGNRISLEDMPTSNDSTFSWYIDNITDSVSYIVNGINRTQSLSDQLWSYKYESCPVNGCPLPVDPNSGPQEDNYRRWSDPDSWTTNELPGEGESVVISSSWRMLMDITPPPLDRVYIYGELVFEDKRDYNFTANIILVRGTNARLIIGTLTNPFTHHVTITLTGLRNDVPLSLASNMILGSKAIGVFGNVSIYGQPHSHTWTRLDTNASQGDTSITIKGPHYPNWSIGDEIIIASSNYNPSEAEIRTIIDYNSHNGIITLDQPLAYDHVIHQLLSDDNIAEWKQSNNTDYTWWDGSTDSLILAPEVGLLSHNIIIQGRNETSEPLEEYHYGCRILVGQYRNIYTYTGHLSMDSVEIHHCGQGGYHSPRDPRYSIAFKNSLDTSNSSSISRCSIHHGYNTAIGLHVSNGVTINNNVIHRTTGSSIVIGGKNNEVYSNLAMLTSTVQPNRPKDNHAVDFPATYDINFGNIVRDNAAAGTNRIAYRYTGDECNEGRSPKLEDEALFWNNTAHSGLTGLVILGLPLDCVSVGGLLATHHWDYTVFSSTASSLVVTHMKIAIGKVGMNLNIFGPDPVSHLLGHKSVHIINSLIIGYLPSSSCLTTHPNYIVRGVSFDVTDPSFGIMMSSFNKKRSKMDGTGSWHLMKNYPTVDGQSLATNVTFAQFECPSGCDIEHCDTFTIGNNPLSPDAVHPLTMTGIKRLSVPVEKLVFFYEPNPEWIVQEDCVDMDCDGPKHGIIIDSDGTFGGTLVTSSIIPFAELRFSNYSSRTPVSWLDFAGGVNGVAAPSQVIHHKGIYRGLPNHNCIWMSTWNGYHCQNISHRMLVIESMDSDSEVRRLSPLALVGGSTWQYTDLLNGPMDHGWCTYYTCLKRLSTFYTIVATGNDYHIWMTGSLPNNIRLHLLNSNVNDSILVHIWYKNPQRKDIYKNGIFIEPVNTKYLNNGAVTQLDGNAYLPQFNSYSGSNYYERTTQILHLTLKGNDPIEIRTPPVVQISLDVAVSLDDFFIYNLINNLAFVLRIDPSRIRVVDIISETSRRKRNTNNTTSNTVTLELGDPPVMNVSTPKVISVEDEWKDGGGEMDSVDMEGETTSSYVTSSNVFNADMPATDEQFAQDYNETAQIYANNLQKYEEAANAIEEINMLGDTIVELIQTKDERLQNASIVGVTVVPASNPTQPAVPVIPPPFENITDDNTLAEVEEPKTLPLRAPVTFSIPSDLVVSREPYKETGHLVHVAVTMYDEEGSVVTNLGLLTPWICTAKLATINITSQIGGVTQVPFINGTAEFTRLRIDSPSSNLTLSFTTNPGNYTTTTSVLFTVVSPSLSTARQMISFTLSGDTDILDNILPESIINSLINGIGQQLDIDVSRIQNITYITNTSSNEIIVNVTILDRVDTDPRNAPTLNEALSNLMTLITDGNFIFNMSGRQFTALPGVEQIVIVISSPSPSPSPPQSTNNNLIILIIAVGLISSSIIVLMMLVAFTCYGIDYYRQKKKKESSASNRVTTRIHGESNDGVSDTDSWFSFRLTPLPRIRIQPSAQYDDIPSHPHMPSDVDFHTRETSMGSSSSEDSSDDERLIPRLPRIDTSRQQENESYPRLPRIISESSAVPPRSTPFTSLPPSVQRRQTQSLAGLMNQQFAAWDSENF